jgi:hypothetical protein
MTGSRAARAGASGGGLVGMCAVGAADALPDRDDPGAGGGQQLDLADHPGPVLVGTQCDQLTAQQLVRGGSLAAVTRDSVRYPG